VPRPHEFEALGPSPAVTPRQIYERIDPYVVGQERAKRAVSIAAYNHRKRLALAGGASGPTLLRKANLLLVGPTGCGKTQIARCLAKVLDVPFVVVDATAYTEAGYYGKDVESMISELFVQAGQELRRAEQGIVFVDEIDKIARRDHGTMTGAGSRDIGGEGVQQALLKLLEGTTLQVPLHPGNQSPKQETVQIDTSGILFICAGTFSDLLGQGEERAVGFRAGEGPVDAVAGGRRRIAPRELLSFGMLAEFLARLPIVVSLDELGPAELRRVLTDPPDALLREYTELLRSEGIELQLSDGALDAIVSHARSLGLGARALRAAVEEVLEESLFLAPERRGSPCIIDEAYARRRLEGLAPPPA